MIHSAASQCVLLVNIRDPLGSFFKPCIKHGLKFFFCHGYDFNGNMNNKWLLYSFFVITLAYRTTASIPTFTTNVNCTNPNQLYSTVSEVCVDTFDLLYLIKYYTIIIVKTILFPLVIGVRLWHHTQS